MNIVGIGIDICKVSRIASILEKPYGKRFISRVLHPCEIKNDLDYDFVASRWAAKEALVKALGYRLLPFTHVRINYNTLGQPIFLFTDTTEKLMSKYNTFLSISHEDQYTVAVVICLSIPSQTPPSI
ncbi:hypothetical protein SteCoe_3540 [Stentor coeruleus]|uniref:4'-phosphopantetheinyl transferase domain-containing protein n=1 Tax=Stentor coeruleus TaxID=5963 RepID=A0A1R2CWP2_9CILI|nr:hypothetical protein SteCoe_3540 [Stentor coeruleus]